MSVIAPDYGTGSSYYTQNFDNIQELLQRIYDNTSNVIVAKDVRDPLWTLWNKVVGLSASLGSASLTYTLGTPSTISVGGIGEGSTFSNVSLAQLFDQMLLPFVAPVVEHFGPSVAEKQFGDTTTLNLTYSINVGSLALDPGYQIQFTSPNPSSAIPSKVVTGNDPETGTTNNFSLTYSTATISVISYAVATMSFKTSDLTLYIATASIAQKHKRYYGQLSIPIGFTPSSPASVAAVASYLTDTRIKGLSYSELGVNVNMSQLVDFDSQYFVFASPRVWGFNYPVGFYMDNIFNQDFTRVRSNSNFTNEFGYVAPYDVYISNQPFYDPQLVSTINLPQGYVGSNFNNVVSSSIVMGDQGPTGPSIISGSSSGNDITFTDSVGYTFSVTDVGILRTTKLFIPSASVLTLNTNPITIVPAPGIGKAIEVISFAMKMTFNSVAYATNTRLELITDTSPTFQAQFYNTVLASSSSIFITTPSFYGGFVDASGNLEENKDLMVSVQTGNPTAGDSDITVYVSYRIIEI